MEEMTTLIDVKKLVAHLGDVDWVVVDCRFDLVDPSAGERAFNAGHIPGARYAHLDRDLSAPITPASGRHPLPEPNALAQRLGAWGIGDNTQVVVYDDVGGAMASRLWWLLRWLGHTRVALLDGGWQRWCSEGREVSERQVEPVIKRFTPRQNDRLWLTTEQVAKGLAGGEILLLDARTAIRYSGQQEPIDPVAGHIPGAHNFPLQGNLCPDGTFRSAASLRADYTQLLAGHRSEEVVHMCGSGVTACLNLLAMEHAGLSGSRLYAGSWSEWIRDPQRPVAQGDD